MSEEWNPVLKEITEEYYANLTQRQDGEEWEDQYGFRFRHIGKEIEILVGGKWVPWLWWLP